MHNSRSNHWLQATRDSALFYLAHWPRVPGPKRTPARENTQGE